MEKLRKRANTVEFKIVLFILLIFIPVAIFMILNNIYAISVVRDQVYKSDSNTIEMLAKQIDANLSEAERSMVILAMKHKDFNDIDSNDTIQNYLFENKVSSSLSEAKSVLGSVDGLFTYYVESGKLITASIADGYLQEQRIYEFIADELQNNPSSFYADKWGSKEVGEKSYLMRALKFDNYYIGAWVNTEGVLDSLQTQNIIALKTLTFTGSDGTLIAGDENGLPEENVRYSQFGEYYKLGSGEKVMVIGSELQSGDVSLTAFISDGNVIEGLGYFKGIIALFIVVIFTLICLMVIFFRKIIIKPLDRIAENMNNVKAGKMDVTVDFSGESNEFQTVGNVFNDMVIEIKKLKIDIYEEKIQKQKAQLQFFQLQVNPHFFINSINIIFSFAQLKDFEMVQKMSLYLAKHYRYTLHGTSSVKLGEELEHIENYMKIQEIRYSQKLNIEIEADEELRDEYIPQLSIQTFVENSVKYTIKLNRETIIKITVTLEKIGETEYMRISVSDNGDGFTKEVLESICSGKQYVDKTVKHIGIYNMQKRLRLMFKDEAGFKFSNIKPCGAKSEIWFPLYDIDKK